MLDRQGGHLRSLLRKHLQEYAQAELRSVDTNMLALHDSLDPGDRERFPFDNAAIDWERYLRDIHMPSVRVPLRELERLRQRRPRRDPALLAVLQPPPGGEVGRPDARVGAFFDMDGTRSQALRRGAVRPFNTLPIDRRGGALSTTPGDVLADGWNLVILPEGTRSRDGWMGSFRLGAAFLAVEHEVPVVPVAHRGTFAAMPRRRRVATVRAPSPADPFRRPADAWRG